VRYQWEMQPSAQSSHHGGEGSVSQYWCTTGSDPLEMSNGVPPGVTNRGTSDSNQEE